MTATDKDVLVVGDMVSAMYREAAARQQQFVASEAKTAVQDFARRLIDELGQTPVSDRAVGEALDAMMQAIKKAAWL